MTTRALSLLGAFELTRDDAPVSRFHSDKVRALLAYLATESDRPHARASLAALLWPEQADAAALRNLSQTLVRMREVLGPGDPAPLQITWQAIQWLPAAASVDVAQFAQLARSDDVADLARAAELYRGEFMAGFALPGCEAFEEWLLLTREQLQQQALAALAALAGKLLAGSDWGGAAAAARRQIELDRWREDAHRQLMRALASGGDRAAALAAYARCEQVLHGDLGIAPDAETRALAEHIQSQAKSEFRVLNVELPAPELNTQNLKLNTRDRPTLPAPLTPLLGRADELAWIDRQLREGEARLVTLVGVGGAGKTRLALAAAWALRDAFADGVGWVALAGVTAAELPLQHDALAAAVGAAIGCSFGGRSTPLDELREHLAGRATLLVLDNCEHLPIVAPLVRQLLEAAPQLRVLATSRVMLEAAGEQPLRLDGLPVPEHGAGDPAGFAAVQLFLERARRQVRDFDESPSGLAAVARLCRMLDGLPLGIELAARWAGHYSCDEIAAEIEADLDFLSVQSGDLPERQRSLRAAFDYSWRLLAPAERLALARLSVFGGAFDRAAAQAVAATRATTLVVLVDASLLRHSGVGRYGFHELLRQFAAERLAESGELEPLAERHAGYYLELMARQDSVLHGSTPQRGMQVLHDAADNMRQAWDWAVGRGAWGGIARSLPVLLEYVRIDGLFYEHAARIALAAQRLDAQVAAGEHTPEQIALLGRLRGTEAYLLQYQGATAAAAAAARTAIAHAEAAGDAAGEAYGYLQLSIANVPYIAALASQETRAAIEWLERAIVLCWSLRDPAPHDQHFVAAVEVDSLLRLSAIRIELREYAAACTHAEQALALTRMNGDRMQEIRALNFYAAALENAGRYEAAYTQRLAMLGLARTNSTRAQEDVALNNLSCTLIYLGDYAGAVEYAQASIYILNNRVRSPYENADYYHTLSWAACRAGAAELALESARQALAFARGSGSAQNQTLPLLALGDALYDLGRYDEAHAAYGAALTLSRDGQTRQPAAVSLAGIARCRLAQGAPTEAQAAVDELLREQDILTLGSLWEPLRVAATCYQVLHANADARAGAVLRAAVAQLDHQAGQIADPVRRHRFREQVAAHRVILEAIR